MRKFNRKSIVQKKVAKGLIESLFTNAWSNRKSKEYSTRYMILAKRIANKYKLTFSKEQKTRYCKKCNSYLGTSSNVRIRINHGKVTYLCKNCKSFRRIPLH